MSAAAYLRIKKRKGVENVKDLFVNKKATTAKTAVKLSSKELKKNLLKYPFVKQANNNKYYIDLDAYEAFTQNESFTFWLWFILGPIILVFLGQLFSSFLGWIKPLVN